LSTFCSTGSLSESCEAFRLILSPCALTTIPHLWFGTTLWKFEICACLSQNFCLTAWIDFCSTNVQDFIWNMKFKVWG
jgi:hypothetical protein